MIQVETREDEEQNVKENQIIDLLLAAGYFRARIKGLTPFDKVITGLNINNFNGNCQVGQVNFNFYLPEKISAPPCKRGDRMNMKVTFLYVLYVYQLNFFFPGSDT